MDKDEPTLANKQGSLAPNWNEVPFDVGCARCGHDLRNLTEPRCPACNFEFDWADAVPLERLTCLHCGYNLCGLSVTRCPECGGSFAWGDALADYHRRKNPLFEYQWRREPIRSLVRTWLWALWPPKLWRRVDLHDPPQVKPLLLWVFISLIVFYASLAVLFGAWAWLEKYLGWRGWGGWPRTGWGDLPLEILASLSRWELYRSFLPIFAWILSSLAALMIFRQSMRLCRVRTAHVVRVWAYATPSMLALGAALVFVPNYGAALPWRWHVALKLIVTLAVLAHVLWSISRAYGVYLRMPHSLAVAIAAQIVAVLGAAPLASRVIVQVLDALGL